MKKVFLFFFVFVLLVLSICQIKKSKAIKEPEKKYPNSVGEIPYSSVLDSPDFKLCDSTRLVQSRLALSYEGGNSEIIKYCKTKLETNNQEFSYDGFVLVRFLINCNKKVGRIRMQTLDEKFLKQEGPQNLVDAIYNSVEDLDKWVFTIEKNQGKDHSKFLNFKIKNGIIESIIH